MDTRMLADPDLETARDAVTAGLGAADMVSVFGRCRVDYEGRASSTLRLGDRLLLLKPDGTALVHTDEGHQPVNWQPPGCEHAVALADGESGTELHVHSTRSTPAEELEVRFSAVAQVSRYAVADDADLVLEGTEADLKRRVLDAPDLVESGFEPRATERDTPAGAVDVYGVDADGNTVVVELKRRRVGPDAVGQLSRYVEALRRDGHAERRVRGVLVAPSVTDRARDLLTEEGLKFVALEPTPE